MIVKTVFKKIHKFLHLCVHLDFVRRLRQRINDLFMVMMLMMIMIIMMMIMMVTMMTSTVSCTNPPLPTKLEDTHDFPLVF